MPFDPHKLASLFNPKKVGYFSTRLFNQLGSHSYGWIDDTPLQASKNFELKNWNPQSLFKDLRADLVIFGSHNVLIIVNQNFYNRSRVYLDEANHYYNGKLRIHGLYLTPAGHTASDPRFINYSYSDLIRDLDIVVAMRNPIST